MVKTVRIRKVGGSTMLAIPPAIMEALSLEAQSGVTLTVDQDALIIRRAQTHYTLAELLAQGAKPGSKSKSPRDKAWVASGPVGKELL